MSPKRLTIPIIRTKRNAAEPEALSVLCLMTFPNWITPLLACFFNPAKRRYNGPPPRPVPLEFRRSWSREAKRKRPGITGPFSHAKRMVSDRRGLDVRRSQRRAADARAGGFEDGVVDGCRQRAHRGFARTRGHGFGMVEQDDIDDRRRLGDVDDGIGEPVDAFHA